MPSPSFFALFRRSKYSSFDFASAPAVDHQRRELFAVAALAFTLKHDVAFRRHFLRNICGAEDSVVAEQFSVLCEEYAFTDLILKQNTGPLCFVIEAKIHAELLPKQDPRSPQFIGGYQKQIEGFFSGSEVTYIVLQQRDDPDRGISSGNGRGIRWTFRKWADLCPNVPESSLVTDLLDSLAVLQIAAFQFRLFHGKPMHKNTLAAADTFRMFLSVAARLGIDEKDIQWDVSNDPKSPFFGFEFKKSSLRLAQVKQALGRSVNGWVGYETDSGKEPEARIWFYTASDLDRKALVALIDRGTSRLAKEDQTFFAIAPSRAYKNQAEWFVSALQALGAPK